MGDDVLQQLQDEERHDAVIQQLRDEGLLPHDKDASKACKKWFVLLCGWKNAATEELTPGVMGDDCFGNSAIRDALRRKLPTAGVGSMAIDPPLSLTIDPATDPSAFTKVWINPYLRDQGVALETVVRVLLQIEDLVDFKFQNPSTPAPRKPPNDTVFPDSGTQWDKHMFNRKVKAGKMAADAAGGEEEDGDGDAWDSGVRVRMGESEKDLVEEVERALSEALPLVRSLFPTHMSALEVGCAGVRDKLEYIPRALRNLKLYKAGKMVTRPPIPIDDDVDTWFLGKEELEALFVLGEKGALFAVDETVHNLPEAGIGALSSLVKELRDNALIADQCQDVFYSITSGWLLSNEIDVSYRTGLAKADHYMACEGWNERRLRNAGRLARREGQMMLLQM
ncbi:hypothetical protein JKP88DRAFT_248406 [Tribonema minus]|uniref:Uncharacterized protein n=1 Tax=Tribonema minus TaxID=303371 RepID=A0A835YM03_9STRA|nr:hypothetical protein JKP88DRAFT_248406 [Tribonema minus]